MRPDRRRCDICKETGFTVLLVTRAKRICRRCWAESEPTEETAPAPAPPGSNWQPRERSS